MFNVLFFITKSRKDETTKITSQNFVLFRFRVFVIRLFDVYRLLTTDYKLTF